MTARDIESAIDAFVRCARNAVDVGFDGIALHGAHGYLIDNFLWEGTNQRDDAWGGDLERRTRFPAAVVAAIRAAREGAAQSYFARHAAEWDQLRGLHSPDGPVEAALLGALDGASLGALLDVGTGTGRIAELLSPRAAQVTGLDKSPEMLRLARTRLQDLPAGSLDLVQGDFTALPFAADSFETVVFHQVLHYAQEPEPALAEAARVCRPGGTIAIVDFAAHDREELRSQHAHARLGFSDEQMLGLLADAGFRAAAPLALPGKPLTVKIWTGTRTSAPQRAAITKAIAS